MEHWKRIHRGVDQTVPLYARRHGFRRREFAVRHPQKGMLSLGLTPRESCYDLNRLRHLTRRARQLLAAE